MKKRLLIIFLFLIYGIGFCIISDKVYAENLPQFKDNGFREFSTELIDKIIENNNVDRSINDSYLLVAFVSEINGDNYYHLILFNSNNVKNKINYVDTSDYFKFIGTDITCIMTSYLSEDSNFYTDNNTTIFGFVKNFPEKYVYYSTADIYDEKGNVLFKANNSNNTKGIEIIKKLTDHTIDFINKNEKIKFEYVLLGMFILNYIIYTICSIIRRI